MSRDLETLRNLCLRSMGESDDSRLGRGATAEEYARPTGGGFRSVQGTLVHLYGADRLWLERFYGRSPRALLEADELLPLDALTGEWREVEAGQQA